MIKVIFVENNEIKMSKEEFERLLEETYKRGKDENYEAAYNEGYKDGYCNSRWYGGYYGSITLNNEGIKCLNSTSTDKTFNKDWRDYITYCSTESSSSANDIAITSKSMEE